MTGNVAIYAHSKLPYSTTITAGSNLTIGQILMIDQNVSITVKPGASLYLDGAHLYSCLNLWKGIIVEDGGRVICKNTGGRDNLIEDAEIAIDARNQPTTSVGTIIEISRTIFNKNRVAIRLTNYSGSNNSYVNPLTVNSSVFTCRLLPYSGTNWPQVGSTNSATTTGADLRYETSPATAQAPPFLGQGFPLVNLKGLSETSQIAVDLQNVGITAASGFTGAVIGSTTSADFNVFDSHGRFVRAENSNARLRNNVFQNTITYKEVKSQGPPVTYKSFPGKAIHAYCTNNFNSELDISGASAATGNRFYDCQHSIDGYNVYRLNCVNNIFRSAQNSTVSSSIPFPSGEVGIIMPTNRFQYMIRYCEFTNIENCINVPLAAGQYTTAATGTVVNSGLLASYVGVVQSTFNPGTGADHFLGNAVNISCVNQFTPVVITNTNVSPPASGIFIEHNDINDVYRGVSVSGITGFHTEVHDNQISLATDNLISPAQYAVKLTNLTGFPSQGFYAIAHSNVVNGTGTSTVNQQEALFFISQNVGLVTPSVCCNELDQSHTGFRFDGPNASSVWAGNSMQPLTRGMELVNNGVLGPQGSTATACNNQWQGAWTASVHYGTWVAAGVPSLGIAASSASSSPLFVNSTLVPPNNWGSAAPQDWYSSSFLTAITGGDYQCNGIPNNIVVPIPTTETYAEGTIYSIAQNLTYRFLRLDPVTKDDLDIDVINFYDGLADSKPEVLMDIETYLNAGSYSAARTLNDAFEPDEENLCEETYSEFYRLYANYQEAVDDEENQSESDSIALANVAFLCPGTHGPAVYQARALFCFIYGYREFGDCQADLGARKRFFADQRAMGKEVDEAWHLTIFPNPAQNQVIIKSTVSAQELRVQIKDVSGRKVFEGSLEVKEHGASLFLPLNDGLYLLDFQNESNETRTKKLVVSH